MKTFDATIQHVVTKHIDPERCLVFLFGSRAGDGISAPASDYDVGLYQGTRIPFRVLASIQDELEAYPIPVDVDLVDFSTVTETFKRLALQHVKIWNQPKNGSNLI